MGRLSNVEKLIGTLKTQSGFYETDQVLATIHRRFNTQSARTNFTAFTLFIPRLTKY